MSLANKLDSVVTSLGKNNKPTYVVMAIATAKGIFRPLFTMMDKTENPETKKYTAIREGLTEVIAIPSYFFCGEMAAKLADRFCGEKLDWGWTKQAIGDEVVAFKEIRDHSKVKLSSDTEHIIEYKDGQKYSLKVLPKETKNIDPYTQKIIKIGDKKFLLDKLNQSEKTVKKTTEQMFSIDNMVIGFKRLKENPKLHNANKNLMFMGVCIAALFVIPALCSAAIKPLMGYIQKPAKDSKLDIESKQPVFMAYNPAIPYNKEKPRTFGTFSIKPSFGLRIGGV